MYNQNDYKITKKINTVNIIKKNNQILTVIVILLNFSVGGSRGEERGHGMAWQGMAWQGWPYELCFFFNYLDSMMK